MDSILTTKEEYFVPEASDLFIGYECERYVVKDKTPIRVDSNFRENVEKALKGEHIWESDAVESPIYHVDLINKGIIRVPYLTKEQIESEGWKFKAKSVDLWWEKEGTFDMGTFTAYKIVMHYGMKGHIGHQDLRMTIYAEDFASPDNEFLLFRGEIKSVNEFRKLSKWLGI